MKRQRSNSKDDRNKLRPLEDKTHNQRCYIRAIVENDIIICSGPAGSGKSYIAAGMAAQYLHKGEVDNIIVTRPLVSSGQAIGALPGEVGEKIAPYLLPMEEKLEYFFGKALYGHYLNSHAIKYKPLELMRGATFDHSFMILDEAQNCTSEQLVMFMSRIGEGSKVVINGDVDQNDLRGRSGLSRCLSRLRNVQGCEVCLLTREDIQRNGIIGRVLEAMED